jgi:2-phosphoglycerate kinase
VLGVSDGEEDAKDPVIIEFAKQIYESLGKKPTSMITKDELVEWTKENVFAHGATNINELYSKLAQIAHVSGEAKEE